VAYRAIVFILAVITALGAGLFVRSSARDAVVENHTWPSIAERRAEDIVQATQPRVNMDPRILIVAADDTSVSRFGAVDTWSREMWALTIRRVLAGEPRAVIMDIALDKRTKGRKDAALWRAIASGGRRTVLGFGYDADTTAGTPDDIRSLRFLEKFALTNNLVLYDVAASNQWDWQRFSPPVSDFTGAARGAGLFLREDDPDGIMRDTRLIYRSHVTAPQAGSISSSPLSGKDVVLTSLPLAGAQAAFGMDKSAVRVDGDEVVMRRRGDPVRIPIDYAGRTVIRYARPTPTNLISFSDIAGGDVGGDLFRDRIVIFGVTAADTKETDNRRTPRGIMPRVFATASILSSILDENFIARSDSRNAVTTLLLIGIVSGLLLPRARARMVGVAGICLAVVYLGTAWITLAISGLLLPILPGLITIAIATALSLATTLVFAAQQRQTTHVPV